MLHFLKPALEMRGDPSIRRKEWSQKLLQVSIPSEKGRAVCTECSFKKGSFVCEYNGELIDTDEAKRREKSYTKERGFV